MDARYRMRPAETADLDAVARLEGRVFGADAWTKETFRPHCGPISHVVLEDGHVIGYVFARVVGGGDAEILNLAVDPSHRRRGIGRAMVETVLSQCVRRGVRRVYLEVRVSNASATALYASVGFSAVSRRRGYYRNPREDALVMCCDLHHAGCTQ